MSARRLVLRGGRVRYSGRAEVLAKSKRTLDEAYFGIDAARAGAHVGV